ncbi:MAG TPA: adenylate/guanylate cyclase domain-containing protein [Solirubrobacteraceae bacterium]|jgi:class 3 adenylate cyclase
MTWWARRRGFFEAPPRVLYRRTGTGYFGACALAIVLNGVVVSGFGVVALVLYVDLSLGEVALVFAVSAAGFAIEGALAACYFLRAAEPARAWLSTERAGEGAAGAWLAAARLPLMLVRRPSLYAIGAVGAAAADVLVAGLLDVPTYQAALMFPMSYLLYISCGVLRYVGVEFLMRPLLSHIGEKLAELSVPGWVRVTIHQRLLATVPMVTWGTALIVGGLVTPNTRNLDTIGLASVVAFGVTAAVSIWLSLVLADAVSGPIRDLRDATRQLGSGDLNVQVPVVSTDETGELTAAFNAMVIGLREREQLREAFGAFVDPALTDRVLAEGTDLRGEEIEASILFLDVRGFTEFAEREAAREVVACLNELYGAVVPVIERHGGHANKFVGDGLLAVFGAPERHADHAARALAAACDIARLVREGVGGELRVGLGVNSGRVVVGTIGGGRRRDFTVIGDPVNTAARVEAATRLTGDDILITESTLRALGSSGDDFEERPSVPLRGKAATVRLYTPRSYRQARARRPKTPM